LVKATLGIRRRRRRRRKGGGRLGIN